MKEKQRIEWLAIVRGLNILLVVLVHAQLIDRATQEPFPIMLKLNTFLGAIRMPLFVFCSGGLLFLSRIDKQWNVKKLYREKFQRIVIPFLFFVVFYYLLKMAMNVFVKTKVDYSVSDFLLSFAIYSDHPSVHLWFLAVLMWFMLLYPLFCWLCKSYRRMVVFLVFSIAIYHVDMQVAPERNYFYLFTLNQYLVYFFSGIFFFRYRLYNYFSSWWMLVLFASLYSIAYATELWMLCSMTGILTVVSLGRQIARFCPGLFSSFREYIYQIYLISLVFQGFVELVVWQRLFYCPSAVLLVYVFNVLVGIYMPVAISKLVERMPYRWLHLALGLKNKGNLNHINS